MVYGMFIGDVIKLVYQQTVDLFIFTSQLVVDLNFGLDLRQHLETYNLLVFGVACTARDKPGPAILGDQKRFNFSVTLGDDDMFFVSGFVSGES